MRKYKEPSLVEAISVFVGGCIGLCVVYGSIAVVVGVVVKVLFF